MIVPSGLPGTEAFSMRDGASPQDDRRANNFGFLRLLFATLVIVSHSPELVDGNRSRELLTRLFGTMSFGEVAVDGFFLISGYLITKSFVQTGSVCAYLVKRVLRIFPGFAVSFWICVLLVAPFVGARRSSYSLDAMLAQVQAMLLLAQPYVAWAFAGLPHPELNGSMWTISYEFRCYLAAALLGVVGVYKPRYRFILLAITGAALLINGIGLLRDGYVPGDEVAGVPAYSLRFFAVFSIGALYYLFRDRVRLTGAGAAAAGAALAALMFDRQLAETAFAILGGYLIFWFAFRVRVLGLSRADNRIDLSYGVYLYAWPIQNILIWNNRGIDPWLLCLLTLAGAALAAFASWTLVEKPCLNLSRGWRHKQLPASSPMARGAE